VSLAVIKDGKPLIVKGYGFANLEHQVPVKPRRYSSPVRSESSLRRPR
jgi:CubicO group peptidase (beta-lactamase class C family)